MAAALPKPPRQSMVAAAPLSARCSMAAPSFHHRAAPSPRSMAPPLLPPSRRSMTAPPPPAVAPVHGGRPSLTFSSRSCRLPFPRRSPAPPQTCLPPPAWSAAASFQQIVGIGHCVTLEGSGRGSRSGCRMPLPTSTAAGGGHRGEGAWQKQASRCHPGCSASTPPARSISAVQRRPRGWTCLPSAVGGCTVAMACHIGLGVLDHQQRAHGCCTRKERLEKEFHTRAAAAGGCHVRIMMGRCNCSSGRIDSPSCRSDSCVRLPPLSPSLGDLGIDEFTGSEPTNPVAKETKSKKHGMSVKCNISRSLFLLSAAVAGTSHKSGHVRVLRCSFISLPSTYLFNIPNGCTNNQPSWSVWDTNPKCVSVKQRLARNGEVENCCSCSQKEEGHDAYVMWGKKGEASNGEPWQFLFSRLAGSCAVCSEETLDGMV